MTTTLCEHGNNADLWAPGGPCPECEARIQALPIPAPPCPVCGEPMPSASRDRRVAASGIVVCGKATCEATADDMDPTDVAGE